MERLMKRCSPEWRRRPAAATARRQPLGGGVGCPWRRRRLPLERRRRQPLERRRRQPLEEAAAALGDGGPWPPFFFLGDGAAMEELPPPWRLPRGGKFVVLCYLSFLSLYRFPNSRHQILGFSKTGIFQRSGLGLGRILGLDPSEENFPQLSRRFDFHLTSSSGPNVTIIPNSTPKRFPIVFLIVSTRQIGKQEDCALWQLLVG